MLNTITAQILIIAMSLHPAVRAGDREARLEPKTMESYVREYYSDEPILAEIARCESEFKHLNSKGDVLRGRKNKFDVGVMQINELYHKQRASTLGIDIHDLEGNLEYARWLHGKFGPDPWSASAFCWKNSKKTANMSAMSTSDSVET